MLMTEKEQQTYETTVATPPTQQLEQLIDIMSVTKKCALL